jgi:hypothetical protein
VSAERDAAIAPEIGRITYVDQMDTRFGECADCGCQLERPFWDTICFTCQDERDHPDDEWEDE